MTDKLSVTSELLRTGSYFWASCGN